MVSKPWRIIPRPLIESVLNNHAHHHRVPQPLLLHGPRGFGKTTLILDRLLGEWNHAPHLTGYVDFAESIKDHHPQSGHSFPWSSWSTCPPPALPRCTEKLETCLEAMAHTAVRLGNLTSHQVFSTLSKWHSLRHSLRHVIRHRDNNNNNNNKKSNSDVVSDKASGSVLWNRAVFVMTARCDEEEIDNVLGLSDEKKRRLSMEEASYYKEAVVALKLAKEVIRVQNGWRREAIARLNRTGGFSRSLANSCTDWPCLLLELLSDAAEMDHFQPKLVINNIEVLKNAILLDESSSVSGAKYHDSLIWRIIALGANERCLPVVLVTSDSYYSYRAYMDFGFPDIFISREFFGWSPQEAKLHMVTDYFSPSEWLIIAEVLGSNSRHLFELYALKQGNYYQKLVDNKDGTFEDIVDSYLAYLQITVVNPAMDKALEYLQNFALDAHRGKISKDKLRFGAPWRHPPATDEPTLCTEWAKIQLMDFVQSFIKTEFGINYLADCSLEIFDDPSAVALVEVGLIYTQRDPSIFRPVSKAIQRCLVRWLVQERLKMGFWESLPYLWQRVIRGRNYRHLMLQIGYK